MAILLLLLLRLILSISPWGLSKLWGGGVPISDIDHSGPRICRLLLHTLIRPPHPPLLLSYVTSPPLPSTTLSPHGITRLHFYCLEKHHCPWYNIPILSGKSPTTDYMGFNHSYLPVPPFLSSWHWFFWWFLWIIPYPIDMNLPMWLLVLSCTA